MFKDPNTGDKVYIYHTKPGELPYGYRATIAIREVRIKDGHGHHKVAYSLCNPTDNFVKRYGLNRAFGRSRSTRLSYPSTRNNRDAIVRDAKWALEEVIYEKGPEIDAFKIFFDRMFQVEQAPVEK